MIKKPITAEIITNEAIGQAFTIFVWIFPLTSYNPLYFRTNSEPSDVKNVATLENKSETVNISAINK